MQYIFLLEVIVQVLHNRNSEGLSMWWGYCIINRANNDHKPSLMNLVFVIMLCAYHSQCFLLANESIAHLVLWLWKPFVFDGGIMWNGTCYVCAIRHRVIKAHKLKSQKFNLENKINGKLQKRIHGHAWKCIKMFQWSFYKNGGEMQKKLPP